MAIYKVGDLYNPSKTWWPDGVAQFSCRGGEYELILFFAKPTRKEIRGVRKGTIELGLVVEGPLIVFLYEIQQGQISWSDAPFLWHRLPERERVLPAQPSGEQRPLLHIVLVDSEGGQIRAQRVVSMSPEMGRELHKAITAQAETSVGPAEFDVKLSELYGLYPTSERLVDLAVVRCRGGS